MKRIQSSLSQRIVRRTALRRRRAFTLVEMIVVITIIVILMAIALPVLSRMRETSRDTQCKSNLRQFGQALTMYGEKHRGLLCSGAFDWRYDGAVTEVGWVADLKAMGTPVGDMLCPSNPAKLSKTYYDLAMMDPAMDSCASRLGSGPKTLPDGTVVVNPCAQLALLPPGAARASVIETMILGEGFNTNYAASWLLVRSQADLEAWGALKSAAGCPPSLRSRHSTKGPLAQARASGSADVASSNIPLMGCGNVTDFDIVLPFDLGLYRAGEPLAEGFTDGPIRNDTLQPPAPSNPTPYTGPGGWWAQWNNQTRQDYRNFGPVHGSGSSRSCNLLFSDGSVKSFVDSNGDGFLNNGFDPTFVGAGLTLGYADATIELPPAEVFSLWSLTPKAGPGMP